VLTGKAENERRLSALLDRVQKLALSESPIEALASRWPPHCGLVTGDILIASKLDRVFCNLVERYPSPPAAIFEIGGFLRLSAHTGCR
jgi:hypothetical protein